MRPRETETVHSAALETRTLNCFPHNDDIHLFPIGAIDTDEFIGPRDLDILVSQGIKSEYVNTAMRWVEKIYSNTNRPIVPVLVDDNGKSHLLGGAEIVSAYAYVGEKALPVLVVDQNTQYMN